MNGDKIKVDQLYGSKQTELKKSASLQFVGTSFSIYIVLFEL